MIGQSMSNNRNRMTFPFHSSKIHPFVDTPHRYLLLA